MTEREAQRRERQREANLAHNSSMTVDEWCTHRRVSRAMIYKLWKQGLGPSFYYVGTRRRISNEADAEWLHQREDEAQSSPEAA